MNEKKKKKAYKPPTIQTEKVFERQALACPKVQPAVPISPPPCRGVFRLS